MVSPTGRTRPGEVASRRRMPPLLGGIALIVAGTLAYAALTDGWPHVPTHGAMAHGFGVPVSYQGCGFHTGQDWFAPEGTPVYAVEAGTVIHVGPMWLDGPGQGRGPHAIVLDHGDHYTTYGHNRAARVAVGERVARGQVIAEVGSEGYSPLPHLHLERIDKADALWTGDWRLPFAGCGAYRDPGDRWRAW